MLGFYSGLKSEIMDNYPSGWSDWDIQNWEENYGTRDEDAGEENLSECCGAEILGEDICSDCREHCK